MSQVTFPYIALDATTSAVASAPFQITHVNQTMTVQVTGLAGSEKAYLQWLDGISGSYTDYYINGVRPYCDAANNAMTIEDAGSYRINKDATVAAVGVVVYALEKR